MVTLGVGAAVNVGTDERRECSHAKEAVVALALQMKGDPCVRVPDGRDGMVLKAGFVTACRNLF